MRKYLELTDGESCMSKARPGEMVFVLLGRDAAAPAAIRYWVEERLRLGKNAPRDQQIWEALESARFMEEERAGARAEPTEFDAAAGKSQLDRIEEQHKIILEVLKKMITTQAQMDAELATVTTDLGTLATAIATLAATNAKAVSDLVAKIGTENGGTGIDYTPELTALQAADAQLQSLATAVQGIGAADTAADPAAPVAGDPADPVAGDPAAPASGS